MWSSAPLALCKNSPIVMPRLTSGERSTVKMALTMLPLGFCLNETLYPCLSPYPSSNR